MIKILNQRIQKHFAFFGPKWFCWLSVFLGSIIWFVDPTLNLFGIMEDVGYLSIHYIMDVKNSGNTIYSVILIVLFCYPISCAIIYLPSFMFLLSNVAVDHYTPSSVRKYYFMYFSILTSPIWYNLLVDRILLGEAL